LTLGIPVLGICWDATDQPEPSEKGRRCKKREYGKATLILDKGGGIFKGVGRKGSHLEVWMSHGDQIRTLPSGFQTIAHSENTPVTAIEHRQKRMYGLQFHPEVVHTPKGLHLIRNFLFNVCGCTRPWTMKSFLDQTIHDLEGRNSHLRPQPGIDSAVVASPPQSDR
jgi:GMP synthase (glutamine-hydrolysing)